MPRIHPPTPPLSVLIIRFGAMGDLLHVSPGLAQLKQAYPEVTVHFLTDPTYVSLVETFPGVDKVWAIEGRRTWQSLANLAKNIRTQGIEAVINLHPSLKTMAFSRLVLKNPLSNRVSVYHKQKFLRWSLPFSGRYPRPVRHKLRRHAVEDFYETLRKRFQLPQLDKQLLIPNILHEACSIHPPHAFRVGIIPGVGAKRGNRAWPLKHYENLICSLLKQDPSFEILLIGGADEVERAQYLCEQVASGRLINQCGSQSLLETVEILKTCQVVVGGDTGPTHLAAALDIPVVGVYGPTSVNRTGPVGTFVETLTPPDSLRCWPCEKPTCPLPEKQLDQCMREVSVESVEHAVQWIRQYRYPQTPTLSETLSEQLV